MAQLLSGGIRDLAVVLDGNQVHLGITLVELDGMLPVCRQAAQVQSTLVSARLRAYRLEFTDRRILLSASIDCTAVARKLAELITGAVCLSSWLADSLSGLRDPRLAQSFLELQAHQNTPTAAS